MKRAPHQTLPLLDALAADLLGRLTVAGDRAPRRIVLWLDPERQFARLIPHLATVLDRHEAVLLRPDDAGNGEGQWPLKLALLRLDAAGDGASRAVVYLPGYGRHDLDPSEDDARPRLWSCYEYRFKGTVWGRVVAVPGAVPEPHDLLSWLRTQGMAIADASVGRTLTSGGADSLLARYAERMRDTVPRDWPRPLRLADVRDDLTGDPRDALRSLFAAPARAVAGWGDNHQLVLDRLATEYGLAPPRDEDATPETLADEFAVQLALAEAWDAFGGPADFPYIVTLPKRLEQRVRQASFLRDDIVAHSDLGPRFRARMVRLEPKYTLADWVRGRSGAPVGLPLLDRARWSRFLTEFDRALSAGGWRVARDILDAWEREATSGAMRPSDGREGEPSWTVIADLGALCNDVVQALELASGAIPLDQLVAAYTTRWYKIDRLHLRLRADSYARGGLEQVRRAADLAYFAYAGRVNERFSKEIETGGAWPPPGLVAVADLRDEVWRAGSGRRGVIVCDSLRWDLAQEVRARLDADGHTDSTLRPVLSTLPSQTQFGMAAMLPLGAAPVTLKYEGDIALREVGGRNLATRDGRKAFLEATLATGTGSLGAAKGGVGFLDMEQLLRGTPIPNGRTVVVYDNKIDEQGHKGTEELPLLARQLIDNICRTIATLHEAGIGTVRVLTDHGFLFLAQDLVDGLGRPEVDINQAFQRTARWAAVKPDSPVTDVILLPSPWPGDPTTLGFPRGVRTLVKAEEYEHGGISLQECVLPYLVSRRALSAQSIGIDLGVTTPILTGGVVPVVIRPAMPHGAQPLGGFQPVTIQLWVETVGDTVRAVTVPQEIEVRPDTDELRPAVYLQEGIELTAGQQLVLRAVHARTGRDLGRIELTLLVDWA